MLFITVTSAIACSVAVLIVLGWWKLARGAFRYPDEERSAAQQQSRN